MGKIDLQEFVWFDLGPKPPEMAINVSESGGFMFNQPAREALPSHIKIGIKPDGRTVCIVEDPSSVYTLPKSGAVHRPELVRHIVSTGVILPVRYAIHREGDCWIAELQAPTSKKRTPVRHPRRISKSEENSILEELKNGKHG